MVISYGNKRELIHISDITGHLTCMQLVLKLMLMIMILTFLTVLTGGKNMFGIVMAHYIISERRSPAEVLEREHNLLVSNMEFKEIFFKIIVSDF